MLTTRYVSGSPNWLDLGTPDIEAAKKFYGGLFGWNFLSAGPEAGGYGMFQLDGKTAAAGMTVTPEQSPSAWNIYFQSPEAEATAEAVRGGGGTVLFDPMDVFDQGRMAVFTDPDGAGFSVWQPALTKGLDLVDEVNSLCWLELYTGDQDAALAFYQGVFGWGTSSMPFPDGTGSYTMVHPAGADPEAMFGGVVPLAIDPTETDGPYWLPYFEVGNCDATVAQTERLGGTVRMPPVDMEGVGRFAKVADPFGARFALMQPRTSGP